MSSQVAADPTAAAVRSAALAAVLKRHLPLSGFAPAAVDIGADT
jgi:hypothetical protein